VTTYFHVTSRRNRESIERHGLDWRHMGVAWGIAGSRRPEVDGVFLCRDDHEADFFFRMNAEGGELDVWAVDGVDEDELVESPNGFVYLPRPVAPADLRRVPRFEVEWVPVNDSGAYRSTLTVTLDDGRVLRDDAARKWMDG
jgi:hypothetical protein